MGDFLNPCFYVSRLGEYVNPDEEQFLLDRYRQDMADSERGMLADLLSGMNPDEALRRQQEAANAAFRRWRLDRKRMLDVAEERMDREAKAEAMSLISSFETTDDVAA
jgi:hypothetical protein